MEDNFKNKTLNELSFHFMEELKNKSKNLDNKLTEDDILNLVYCLHIIKRYTIKSLDFKNKSLLKYKLTQRQEKTFNGYRTIEVTPILGNFKWIKQDNGVYVEPTDSNKCSVVRVFENITQINKVNETCKKYSRFVKDTIYIIG